jgi:predicted component of type VI protein secretion system
MEAKLVVIGGKVTKTTLDVDLPTVLGRGREAKLRIGDSTISRKHCQVYEKDGLVMLQDLGSLNGTVVHGQPIKEAPLPPGAEFTIGGLTFRVEYEYDGDLSALPEAIPADEVTTQLPATIAPVGGAPADIQVLAPSLNTLETGPSASNSDDFALLMNASTQSAASGPDLLDMDEDLSMAIKANASSASGARSEPAPSDAKES